MPLLDLIHEGVNLTKTHLTIQDLKGNKGAVIVLNSRTHAGSLDSIEQQRNVVLHEQLS